jgi:hypothetical protein
MLGEVGRTCHKTFLQDRPPEKTFANIIHVQEIAEGQPTQRSRAQKGPGREHRSEYADLSRLTDIPVGERKSLREIQELVRDDPELQNLTLDQEKELLKDLEDHRALKKTGARASNLAAAQDVYNTVTHIHSEVSEFPGRAMFFLTFVQQLASLAQRTGIYSFTFVSQSHTDDLSRSAWYATGDCVKFIREALKIDLWDLARLFEHWACTQDKSESSMSYWCLPLPEHLQTTLNTRTCPGCMRNVWQ